MLVVYCDKFGLLDDRDRMSIQVALEEALLNSVIHGNLEVSSKLQRNGRRCIRAGDPGAKTAGALRSRRVTLIAEYTREYARFTIATRAGFDVNKVRNPTERRCH